MSFYQNTVTGPQYYQPSGPFYEATPPGVTYSPISGWSGGWQYGGGGGYTPPSTTPVASNIVSSYGLTDAGDGMYYYPTADKYFSGTQFYTGKKGAYEPYTSDVTGFNKTTVDDVTTYDPSMAYLSTLNRTPFQQYATQQAPLKSLGYNPALGMTQGAGLYQPAIGNLLSSPTAMTTPQGNYGAGKYLSGLLGSPINYGSPNDTTGSNS